MDLRVGAKASTRIGDAMPPANLREGRETARSPWGFPHASTVRTGAARVLAATGLAASIWGLATATTEVPDAGVHFQPPPGNVTWVLPGGPAWESGVRVGQTVTSISTGTTALDWVLVARDASGEHHVTAASITATLRGLVPLAAVALVASLLAALATLRMRRLGSAVASLAGAAGVIALTFGGEPIASSIGGLLTLAFPLGWLLAWSPGSARARGSVAIGGLAVAGSWLVARFAILGLFDAADTIRLVAALVLALAVISLVLDLGTIRAGLRSAEGPVVLDLLGFGIAGGLAVSLWLIAGWPGAAVTVVTGVAAVVYLRTRRPLARAINQAVFGEREQRASIAAAEAERMRLARDLHDEPLQALGAAIRRLETTPDPRAEADRLREVAAQLRSVATDLHPPILDDLGLGPGLDFLVGQANRSPGAIPVSLTLDDRADRSAERRPPREVEVALFRIVQEAIANAQKHSRGSRIEVAGQLGNEIAHLEVIDDGIGFHGELPDPSDTAGTVHLGLRSMRERAAAIGADLSIRGRPGNRTVVSVDWSRR